MLAEINFAGMYVNYIIRRGVDRNAVLPLSLLQEQRVAHSRLIESLAECRFSFKGERGSP